MEKVFPFLAVYVIGFASPFALLRWLIGNRTEDGNGCFLDACLAGLGLILAMVIFFWAKEVLG